MVREIYDTELDDLLKLYLDLHEDTVPEMTEHLKITWETIIKDNNHHINEDIIVSSNERILKWFSLCEICDLDMPFTAKYVIQHYLSEGIKNEKIYGGVTSKDGVVFTELEAF